MAHRYLSVFQWFIFLLINSIPLPIVIGDIFQLSPEEVSSLMQRIFFVVGISSFLQGWLGHRLPIIEGPAGLWVSVFVILAEVAAQQGESTKETLQILEGGLIIAAILLFVLGLTRNVHRILTLFTPLVTGSFLFILALQLGGVFLEGMMGLQGEPLRPDYSVTILSFAVFFLIIIVSNKGKGWVKNYAVLIGIISGWSVYALLGKTSASSLSTDSLIKLPEVFAWGPPQFNVGMTITAVLLTFILISNMIAAIVAVKEAVPESQVKEEQVFNRSSWAGGISHFLSSLFSTIGVVPLSVSAGFIRLTKQTGIRPFLVASLMLSGLSVIPEFVHFLALLPQPIASAALLASFVQMIGIAFQSILKEELDQRRLTILGITLLIGIGVMFLPSSVFQGLPSILQYVLSNGLIVGVIIVILMEQLWKAKDRKEGYNENKMDANGD